MVKKPIAETPLSGVLKKGQYGAKNPSLTLSEIIYDSTVQVICYEDTERKLNTTLKKLLGVALPKPNTSVAFKKGRIMWAGVHRYHIVSSDKKLLKTLSDSTPIKIASVVDLSHARAIYAITGMGTLEVLAKGASVDFKGDDFKRGTCVLTNMAHIGIMVDCLDRTDDNATVHRM